MKELKIARDSFTRILIYTIELNGSTQDFIRKKAIFTDITYNFLKHRTILQL